MNMKRKLLLALALPALFSASFSSLAAPVVNTAASSIVDANVDIAAPAGALVVTFEPKTDLVAGKLAEFTSFGTFSFNKANPKIAFKYLGEADADAPQVGALINSERGVSLPVHVGIYGGTGGVEGSVPGWALIDMETAENPLSILLRQEMDAPAGTYKSQWEFAEFIDQ